uniref:Uncharacterized protein n=1 Tax=Kalanchoe fedtschenkoi TaxID=63787 RepID=A0A7N0REW0_KALFE
MSGVELAVASGAGKALASSLLSKKVIDFFSTWKLDSFLLDKLEIQLNSVEALLSDAQEKLIEENTRVEKWVQKARFAIYDAEDLLDKILADVPGSSMLRTDIIDLVESSDSVRDKLKYKVKSIHPFKKTIEEELGKIIERLQFIAAQKEVLGLKEKNELASYRKGRLSTSLANETSIICGRSEDKETIMRMLNSREGNDDALRVIPIIGMGGIGKTTLACMVFHEYRSLNRSFGLPSWIGHLLQRQDNSSTHTIFDVKGWACVSDDFDATRINKSLLESVTGQESKVDNNLELLQHELKKKLQGKKFLVVLDDIWSDDPQNWDAVRTSLSVGAPGSRVIVTTRWENVAHVVSSSHNFFYELDKLSRDESWSLFEKIVFRDGNSNAHPILIDIGKEIVRRCKGLPLAIKMVGGLLLSKGNDETEWRSVLNNKIWENTKIIPSLRLSYYHLPLGVQNCFAYCSIFPKDYTFSMEEVIMLWIGEGLIEKFCDGNRYEDVARTYFTHLRSKFFFQESSGGSKFVMHDLVHDLAMHVSRGLCVDFKNVTVQSRRLSYIQGKDEPHFNQMSGTKLSHLRTFMPLSEDGFSSGGRGFYFNNKLLSDLLSNFKLLRVLSLEGYTIFTLPEAVGDMKLLRYLNLSSTNIDSLPDKICRLYNLQILLLSDCWKLKRLPAEICNLVNLRHLNFKWTELEEMPDGIGSMRNIRTLSKFKLGRGKSKQMREFKELLNLEGKLHISSLNNVDDVNDIVIASFKNKEYIKELVLDWDSDWGWGPTTRARVTELDEKVLDAIEAHKKLKSLTIRWYGGKRLSDWIVSVRPSFTAMASLCISNCFHLEVLPSLGNLPFLKCLKMQGLNCIESFGEEFYGDSPTPFQALEELHIDGMDALKTWCSPGCDRLGFQILCDLQIRSCRKLTKIPYCFPSLTQIFIGYCNNLIKFETFGEAKEGSSSVTACRHLPFQSVHITMCPNLEEIPNNFANSDSFEIGYCEKLVSLPRLQHVRKLKLHDVSVSLPVNAALHDCGYDAMEELTIESPLSNLFCAEINRLTSLKSLQLIIPNGMRPAGSTDEDCEVISLPPHISDFTICHGTFRVHTKVLTELSNLSSLTKLELYQYASESLPDVELPSTLKSLTVGICFSLRTVPDRFLSSCMKSLQELWVIECDYLVCLPSSLSTLESLEILSIRKCGSIRQFPILTRSGLYCLTSLSSLWISDCRGLECLPDGLHKATTLLSLHIEKCPNLHITEDGDGFPANLRKLRISDCGKMKPFVKMVLPTLTSLRHLELEEFADISTLEHCLPESIQYLKIKKFPRLKSLSRVLPSLKHLRRLYVYNCPF